MATLGDGFKNIFLAGIGAVAIGAEKGKDLVDQLVAHGEMTVEQGKQINSELKHRAGEVESSIRRDTIEARMSMMTPDERIEFANIVREMADTANAKEAEAAAAKVEAANAASAAATGAAADVKAACVTAVAAVGAAAESVVNGAKAVFDEAAALNVQKAASAEAVADSPTEVPAEAPIDIEAEAPAVGEDPAVGTSAQAAPAEGDATA